jgi:hypothetical protein
LNTSETFKLFKYLKNILKTLEKIEENTRRLLLLAEVDTLDPIEVEGGSGEQLREALERLDLERFNDTPSIVEGDEEQRRRVI